MPAEPERKRLQRKTYIPYEDPPWTLQCPHIIKRPRAGSTKEDRWQCKWYVRHRGNHYAHHHADPNEELPGTTAEAEKSSEEIFRALKSD
jgi:hypothetical protein